MRKQLLQELKLISEEEKKYQSGQGNIEKQLYAKDSISEIDRELLLERGRLVTVRPHSRFVEFPEHRHNYVEMMYVVQGNITHIIEGKELTLHKGDVLMLNQQVRHAIRRAEYEDIGINFIALPEFFESRSPCCMRKMYWRNLLSVRSGRKIPFHITCCSSCRKIRRWKILWKI